MRNLFLLFVILSLFVCDVIAASKKIVFLVGGKSHGYFSHDHKSGCNLLANHLKQTGLHFETVLVEGYPKDPSVFDGAAAIVVYCDGGDRHLLNEDSENFDKLMRKGVGLVNIHYGVETTKGEKGDAFLNWVGGYFEPHWSVNPHWMGKFENLPNHPITRGVNPFEIHDEWYYHMRFRESMDNLTPILTALPPAETLSRKDGPHSNNPYVREDVLEKKLSQPVAWAYQRKADYSHGRGFGITGGHDHVNWAHPDFRRIVLNAICWVSQTDVPNQGVKLNPVTLDELQQNADEPVPDNFDAAKYQTLISKWYK